MNEVGDIQITVDFDTTTSAGDAAETTDGTTNTDQGPGRTFRTSVIIRSIRGSKSRDEAHERRRDRQLGAAGEVFDLGLQFVCNAEAEKR